MQADKQPVNHLRALAAHINIVDCLILLAFAVYALLFFLGRWQGQKPFVFLYGDAGTIAGFAAALDHPQNFIGDAILNDPANFRWYMTIHIPLMRVLAPILGDYGSAFIYQLGFHIFLQLAGFYLLGRVVFHNRYWALLLAVMCMATLWSLGYADYWGVFDDPQPRFTFQAFLPYLLSAAILWRSKPARWPWLVGAAGLLTYVHPVSAPAWGLSIWLGLWLFMPETWPPRKRAGYMGLLGLLYVISITPFVATYLSLKDTGNVGDYQQAYDLMKSITPAYMDIPGTFFAFLSRYVVYVCLAILGAVAVAILDRGNRKILWLTILWLAGVILVSVVFSTLEHQISRALHRLPVQTSLVRGIRFIVPFIILYWLWGLQALRPELARVGHASLIFTLAGSMALLYLYHAPLKTLAPRPQHALGCWLSGQWTCIPPEESAQVYADTIDILEAVKTYTPAGTRVVPMLSEGVDLAVRYDSLRPVPFISRDYAILAFSNEAAFWGTNDLRIEYDGLVLEPPGPEKFQKMLAFARKVQAERVIMLNSDILPEDQTEGMLVYQNQTYSLLDLDPK